VLEDKAREYEIANVASLFSSSAFRSAGYLYDRASNSIEFATA
jgi:DNA replication licensing factor MCM2